MYQIFTEAIVGIFTLGFIAIMYYAITGSIKEIKERGFSYVASTVSIYILIVFFVTVVGHLVSKVLGL